MELLFGAEDDNMNIVFPTCPVCLRPNVSFWVFAPAGVGVSGNGAIGDNVCGDSTKRPRISVIFRVHNIADNSSAVPPPKAKSHL